MTAPGHQPPLKSSDEESDSSPQSEQEIQLAQEKALQEEVPELATGSFMLQMVGALGLAYVSNRANGAEAFRLVNSKQFAQYLLRIKDPKLLAQMKHQLDIVQKEVARQEKRRGRKLEDQEKVKVGFGRFKQEITVEGLNRRREAYNLARNTQGKINGEIIKEKIATTCNVYGLNDESRKQLMKGMAKWLKTNRGATIDQYLLLEGRKTATVQLKSEGKTVDKKTLDAQQKQLSGTRTKKERTKGLLEQAEDGKIKEHLQRLRSSRRAIADILDPSKKFTPLTTSQMQEIVLGGQYAPPQPPKPPPPQPKYDLTQLAGGFAEGAHFEEIMGGPPSPPPTIQPAPITAKTSIPGTSSLKNSIMNFLKQSAALQAVRLAMRNALAYSLKALRSVKLLSTAKVALSFARSALPFLFKTASRAAITAGAAAASLGTTLFAQLGLEALKKVPGLGKFAQALDDAIMGTVKWAAYFAVGAVVGILVFVYFGAQNLFSYNTINNPVVVQHAQNQNVNYSWNEFEKKFLAKQLNSEDKWVRFERDNFIQGKEFLSLNPDGHN